MKRFRAPELPNLPRFFGGAVGFLAYDIVRCFEKIPETAHDDLGTPDFYLMFTDTVLCFDNVRQTLKIIANVPVEEFASTQTAYQSARMKIDEIIERLKRPAVPPFLESVSTVAINDASITSNMTREGYMAMVSRREGIYRGRRRHPGRSVAALRGAADRASVQHLPQPAHD